MKSNNRKIFINYIIPYLLILMIPLLIGNIAYNKSFETVEKSAEEANLAMLGQCQTSLDSRLSNVQSIMDQLSSNENVIRFEYIKMPHESQNIGMIWDASKVMYNYRLYDNLVFFYYIAFKESNMVMYFNGTSNQEAFYNRVFSFDIMDLEAWRSLLFGQYQNKVYYPQQQVTFQRSKYGVISCIQSLGFHNDIKGAVVMLLDGRVIKGLLDGLNITKGGWAYIADGSGNVLCSASTQENDIMDIQLPLGEQKGSIRQYVNGKSMFVTYTTSKLTGWKYVLVQPVSIVMSKLNDIKAWAYAVLAVSLFTGLLASVIMARRNAKPIYSILSIINPEGMGGNKDSRNAFDLIKTALLNLMQNQENMNNVLQQQIPFTRAALLDMLLKGNYTDEMKMKAISSHISIHLNASLYIVAIAYFGGYNELLNVQILEEINLKKVLLKKLASRLLNEHVYIHDLDHDSVALLLLSDNADVSCFYSETEEKLRYLLSELTKAHIGSIAFALGNICDAVTDIPKSYAEAQQALNAIIIKNMAGIVWQPSLVTDSKSYSYPPVIEARLIRAAKAGDKQGVTKLLDDLYSENFTQRKLAPNMLKLLMYEMLGSLIRLLDQISSEAPSLDTIRDLVTGKTPGSQWFECQIRDSYMWICDTMNDMKHSHNTDMIAQIQVYLSQECANSNLSLTMVAERFSLSDVYLSQFFKEQTGENFSERLENLRMEHAKNLLSATNLQIQEIALKVGYNSSSSFCRVFRRLYGISANEYRQKPPAST